MSPSSREEGRKLRLRCRLRISEICAGNQTTDEFDGTIKRPCRTGLTGVVDVCRGRTRGQLSLLIASSAANSRRDSLRVRRSVCAAGLYAGGGRSRAGGRSSYGRPFARAMSEGESGRGESSALGTRTEYHDNGRDADAEGE